LTGSEFIERYARFLSENKKAMEANRFVADKARAEEKSRQVAKLQNVDRIKKGDYSQVKSCTEISEAMNVPISLFQTAVTPPNTMFTGAGILKKHNDKSDGADEILRFESEYLDVDRFAKLRLSRNTLVIGAKKRYFDGGVHFVGRYSSNDSVRLTNGTSEHIPVFDAVCVEY
jgi:hypothetical protein